MAPRVVRAVPTLGYEALSAYARRQVVGRDGEVGLNAEHARRAIVEHTRRMAESAATAGT